ncbi:MAG: type II/IV secretion system ATPase subunit [Thermoprotei archaeon]
MFFNKFKSFLTDIGKRIIVNLDNQELRKLVETVITESRIKPVKVVNPIEQYTVDEMFIVYIIGKDGVLEYAVVEPDYNDEVVDAVYKLYHINPHCNDVECLQETIARSNDNVLQRIYSTYPLQVTYYYLKLASGYGALYPLTRDALIEEISGSSDDTCLSIIHRKYSWYGWMNTNICVDPHAIDRIVLSLARKAGRHLSLAYPVAEGITSEGFRVSLTYGREVSRKGSSFVIRKKPVSPWTITKLIDHGMLNSLVAAYLWLVMELRGSILIVGGVGTGKTTLMQGLLTLIPPSRRVVTIEDTPEIAATTGLWDSLVERVSVIGDSAGIDMYALLKFSLRRRPDYLVVGEVRGIEARLLVQASRLGHGIIATMHAESAEAAIERLIGPPISLPRNMLSNIWCIVVMESEYGKRRVKGVYEIGKRLGLIEVFKRIEDSRYKPSDPREVAEKTLRLKHVLDVDDIINELRNRVMTLERLVSNGVFEFNRLSDELSRYYYEVIEKEVLNKSG